MQVLVCAEGVEADRDDTFFVWLQIDEHNGRFTKEVQILEAEDLCFATMGRVLALCGRSRLARAPDARLICRHFAIHWQPIHEASSFPRGPCHPPGRSRHSRSRASSLQEHG